MPFSSDHVDPVHLRDRHEARPEAACQTKASAAAKSGRSAPAGRDALQRFGDAGQQGGLIGGKAAFAGRGRGRRGIGMAGRDMAGRDLQAAQDDGAPLSNEARAPCHPAEAARRRRWRPPPAVGICFPPARGYSPRHFSGSPAAPAGRGAFFPCGGSPRDHASIRPDRRSRGWDGHDRPARPVPADLRDHVFPDHPPAAARAKEHQDIIKNVRRGDTVVMNGGLIGKRHQGERRSRNGDRDRGRRAGSRGSCDDRRGPRQGRARQGRLRPRRGGRPA